MIDVSGSAQLPSNPTLNDFLSSDYSLVAPAQLVGLFSTLGRLCEPPTEPIPTMGEWGIMSLLLLFLICGVTAMKNTAYKVPGTSES